MKTPDNLYELIIQEYDDAVFELEPVPVEYLFDQLEFASPGLYLTDVGLLNITHKVH